MKKLSHIRIALVLLLGGTTCMILASKKEAHPTGTARQDKSTYEKTIYTDTGCVSGNNNEDQAYDYSQYSQCDSDQSDSDYDDDDFIIMRCGENAISISCPFYEQTYLKYKDEVIYANPLMYTDSINPSVLRVYNITGYVDLDFSNKSWRKEIGRLNPKVENVSVFEKKYHWEGDFDTMSPDKYYSLRIDLPSNTLYPDKLVKWIINGIVDEVNSDSEKKIAHYKGDGQDIDKAAEWLARKIQTIFSEGGISPEEFITHDYRLICENDKYLSYQKYAFDFFSGAAHGNHIAALVTYDLNDNKTVTNDILFTKDSDESIRSLLCEAILKDPRYSYRYGDNENYSVREKLETVEKPFLIPQPGITPDGLVFTFQPYVLGSGSEGCYHIFVPYEKIKPYLTAKGRSYFSDSH